MATSLVTCVPREIYSAHLCTTRRSGALEDCIGAHVGRLRLERRHRLDLVAVRSLVRYIRDHEIAILHAHGSTIFTAAAAAQFARGISVIWHLHYGTLATEQRSGWPYRLIKGSIETVVAASEALAEWAQSAFGWTSDRVRYVPNFSTLPPVQGNAVALPGSPGLRVVSVANLVREKDHATLVRAMASVTAAIPSAHLLLVGAGDDRGTGHVVRDAVEAANLTSHVSFLGQRTDINAILHQCDIGVISSYSEGLPLALLEYGLAALPAVTTAVGQCTDVVDGGRCGIVVPPRAPAALAAAIVRLLRDPEERRRLACLLQQRVHTHFAPDRVIAQVCEIYDRLAR
jgi:glycosyltransferase involved in cell wall biosynthesis